jgi:hypothetical protein
MSHTDIIPHFLEITMLILFISKSHENVVEKKIPQQRLKILINVYCFISNPHAVLAAGDFKSPVSTIPPQPHSNITKLGRTGFEPV